MSGPKVTKSLLQKRVRGLIAGTQKHAPTGPLTMWGATYTAATIVQVLQSLADALAAVNSAKAGWQDALKNATDVKARVTPVVQAYRSWVVVTYGNAPSTLADYGVTPPKVRTPLTAEQKVVAAAKAKATRKARNTLGKRQKKSVKAAAPVTAPIASPPASPPVAAPPGASPVATATPHTP